MAVEPLAILADVPTAVPGLGFQAYADALAGAVRGGEPPQFTIGLYGAWGTGKSSLLRAIEQALSSASDVTTVMFDAWRYERSDIVVPLLHAIYRELEREKRSTLADHVRNALRGLAYSASFSGFGISANAGEFLERFGDTGITALDEVFAKPFSELAALRDELDGHRIVVLIDDLDRCSAEKVVAVFEAINLVMDVPGFVFVVALDYDVLIAAIQERYPHLSGHDFVQKIIQVPFRVPPLVVDANFLEALVPDWTTWQAAVPREAAGIVGDIAATALNSNPRQVKRLLNSLLLIWRVIETRGLKVDAAQLAALIGVQLAWPRVFSVIQRQVIDGNDDFMVATEESEYELAAPFLERFFPNPDLLTLRGLFQLTRVVAADDADEFVLQPAVRPGTPAEEVERFIQGLWERGFRRSPRSSRLYYSEALPDARFVIGKQRVRLEKRVGRGWRLWESYLISRELHLALRAADEPHRHFTRRGL